MGHLRCHVRCRDELLNLLRRVLGAQAGAEGCWGCCGFAVPFRARQKRIDPRAPPPPSRGCGIFQGLPAKWLQPSERCCQSRAARGVFGRLTLDRGLYLSGPYAGRSMPLVRASFSSGFSLCRWSVNPALKRRLIRASRERPVVPFVVCKVVALVCLRLGFEQVLLLEGFALSIREAEAPYATVLQALLSGRIQAQARRCLREDQIVKSIE